MLIIADDKLLLLSAFLMSRRTCSNKCGIKPIFSGNSHTFLLVLDLVSVAYDSMKSENYRKSVSLERTVGCW